MMELQGGGSVYRPVRPPFPLYCACAYVCGDYNNHPLPPQREIRATAHDHRHCCRRTVYFARFLNIVRRGAVVVDSAQSRDLSSWMSRPGDYGNEDAKGYQKELSKSTNRTKQGNVFYIQAG